MKINVNEKTLEFLYLNSISYKTIDGHNNSIISVDVKNMTDKQIYQLKKLNRSL